MSGDRRETETNEPGLGDALAGLVHAGQAVRRAARKQAAGTVAKVAAALADL